MCKMKSGIILKDRIFLPDYDSHSQMLEELKIEDTAKNAETLFIRAELVPPNGDVFLPVDEWVFRVDQDITPDWYVKSYDGERMRQAVKEWAKEHIHIGKDDLVITSGASHYIKDCKNVKIGGSASISYVCDSASISKVCDSASISEVCDSASISEVCDSAVISSSPWGWKNKGELIISGNATFKDRQTKTIWQSGDWKLQIVDNTTISNS